MLLKNDKDFTPELLESLRPSKKVKKPETTDPLSDEVSKSEQKSVEEGEIQEGMDEERD